MSKSLFKKAEDVLIVIALFFSQIAPSAGIGLDELIAGSTPDNPQYFLLPDNGGYAAYGNFRDFSSVASGGAVPVSAADIDITLQTVSIPSGLGFPFRDQLLFESGKWAVGHGQTLQIAFSYDATACLECAFAGSRLSLNPVATTVDSRITINSDISPNPIFGLPFSVSDQLVNSSQGLSEEKLFLTFLTGLPSMTVRTEINMSGGTTGKASLQSLSQAYIVTPVPASVILFLSAMVAMGLFNRPNKSDLGLKLYPNDWL